MKEKITVHLPKLILLCMMFSFGLLVKAQFVHPGGMHTITDLNRMKEKVNSKSHPWIDGWNLMIKDSKAQKNYVAKATSTISGFDGNRQQAARDATAAYYNVLRWYISGDTAHAECAVRILNAWSSSIQSVVTGQLFQIPISIMAQAAELLRIYPSWKADDFNRFKNVCLNYFYPACHDFLNECGGFSSWEMPAVASILYIGVLTDDQAKFDEAINYYKKEGIGEGNILNMICQPSGQFTEMGRDQPHAEIGPGCAAEICQTAWNQGVDLFGYSKNLLLSASEYFCKYNLNHSVNWVPYNDCKNNHFYYPATKYSCRILNNPEYEILYNHYVVEKGLKAPYTQGMLKLRGIYATQGEYVGYNALTFTLDAAQSPFSILPIPSAPTNLIAKAGFSRVEISWTPPIGDVANGFIIQRSTNPSGPYSTIAIYDYEVTSKYTDKNVMNDSTYYYRIASKNNAGISDYSSIASSIPINGSSVLPEDWSIIDIGSVAAASSAKYSMLNNRSYIVRGTGTSFGGATDSHGYLCTKASGDFIITVRLHDVDLSGSNSDRVGLEMRESLNPNAKMVSIGLMDGGFRKVFFSSRASTKDNSIWSNGDTHTWLPVWFKLTRLGNTFTGYQSQDGLIWFEVGTATIPISSTCYAGLYVVSGTSNPEAFTTAYINNVSIENKLSSRK